MILHHDLDDFLTDLTRDLGCLPEPMLRIVKTRVLTRDPMFHDFYLYASYLRRTEIVRLQIYLGSLWTTGPVEWNAKTYRVAEGLVGELQAFAEKHGLQVRGGRNEPNPNGQEG